MTNTPERSPGGMMSESTIDKDVESRVSEIEERLAKAKVGAQGWTVAPDIEAGEAAPYTVEPLPLGAYWVAKVGTEADAALVAAAPDDIRFLLSHLRELEVENKRLREALEEIATETWNPAIGLPAMSPSDLHDIARQALAPTPQETSPPTKEGAE